MPLLELAQRATQAGGFHVSSSEHGRDHGDVEYRQNQHGGSPHDFEISQLTSNAGGPLPCGALFVDDFEQNQPAPVALPATTVASFKLATHTSQSTSRQFAAQCFGPADSTKQTYTLRLCRNSTGKSCYINSVTLGLAWSSLAIGMQDDEWSDGGSFLKVCVHPTLIPLDVHHSFETLLGNLLTPERINVQHDVAEFARYLFSQLQPAAFDMTWWPKWSLADGPAMDQNMDDYPRGGKWDALSISLPAVDSDTMHCTDTFTLQSLINQWHDASGMCNVCTKFSRGKLLQVDRQVQLEKDMRQLISFDRVFIPHSATYHDETHWIPFEAVALTYHLGQHVESGHYRTMVQVRDPESGKAWKDYEDSKLPDDIQTPNDTHRRNVILIWMQQTTSIETDCE